MGFDVAGALKAGYSEAEIAEYLGSESGFDTPAAIKAGYSPRELIEHLAPVKAPARPAEEPAADFTRSYTDASEPVDHTSKGGDLASLKAMPEQIVASGSVAAARMQRGLEGLDLRIANAENDDFVEQHMAALPLRERHQGSRTIAETVWKADRAKLPELKAERERLQNIASSGEAEIKALTPEDQGTLGKVATAVAGSFIPTTAGIVTAVATKSPLAGASVMGATVFGDAVSQTNDAGIEARERQIEIASIDSPQAKQEYLKSVLEDKGAGDNFKAEVSRSLAAINADLTAGKISEQQARERVGIAFDKFSGMVDHVAKYSTPENAVLRGFFDTAAEIVGERIGLGAMLKTTGKPLKDILRVAITEAGQEIPTQFLQSMSEKALANPNKTVGEIAEEMVVAGGAGAVFGGAMGGVNVALNISSGRAAANALFERLNSGTATPEDRAKIVAEELSRAIDSTNIDPVEVAAPIVSTRSVEEAGGLQPAIAETIAAADTVVDAPGPEGAASVVADMPIAAGATLADEQLQLYVDAPADDDPLIVDPVYAPGATAAVLEAPAVVIEQERKRQEQINDDQRQLDILNTAIAGEEAGADQPPLRAWREGPVLDPAAGTIGPAHAAAQREHFQGQGLRPVYYAEEGQFADGAFYRGAPGVVFLSNNPEMNRDQVAFHEVTHALEGLKVPGTSTTYGQILREAIARGMTSEGWAQSTRFAVTAPDRPLSNASDAENRAHGDRVLNHLLQEMGADAGGEAPRFKGFMEKVFNHVEAEYGGENASKIIKAFIQGIRNAFTTLQKFFPTGETQSQKWLSNLEEVHDILAHMHAMKYGTQIQKEKAKLAEQKREAKKAKAAQAAEEYVDPDLAVDDADLNLAGPREDVHLSPKVEGEQLADGRAITAYIESTSPKDVDTELIEEMFRDSRAVLKTVPISELREGDPDHNIPDKAMEKRYAALKTQAPPIVVENGEIIDGNHRFRVAKARGDKNIQAYVVQDAKPKPQFSPKEPAVLAAFKTLVKQDPEAFQYPRTHKKAIADVFKEIAPGYTVTGNVSSRSYGEMRDGVVKKWIIETADKKAAFIKQSKKGEVWVDVSPFKSGVSQGSRLYAAVSDYAANNGLVFVGDPSGLSDAAVFRRTENMFSSALKHETTRHLAPGKRQINPEHQAEIYDAFEKTTPGSGNRALRNWVEPMTWGDDENTNMLELARVSFANAAMLVPEIKDVTYNVERHRYENGSGQAVELAAVLRRAQESAPARGFGHLLGRPGKGVDDPALRGGVVGIATLQRAVLANTLLRAASGEGGSASVDRTVAELSGDRVAKRVFYSPKGTKLKAESSRQITAFLRHLTPSERARITDQLARNILAHLAKLPSANEMAAIAHAGRAKRGWYERSSHAISSVFGPDAPHFAALLAALSPQTSVESNLRNALNVWEGWIAAGRPVERKDIFGIMAERIEGGGTEASVLNAWRNNTVRALTDEDPRNLELSGPKVNSFFSNLIGVVEEVTNDTWMANYAGVSQQIFGGVADKFGIARKGSGYLAFNSRVREAAAAISKYTGETWTPAEIQETIWSWAKATYEHANSAESERTAVELTRDEILTPELIAATPSFDTLFHDTEYADILRSAGYADEIETLGRSAERRAAEVAQQGPGARSQAGPFTREAQKRYELAAARRLDALAEASRDIQRSPGRGSGVAGLREASQEALVGAPSTNQPYQVARDAAAAYMKTSGLSYTPVRTYAQVDVARASRIANAFEAMKHDPQNPEVRAAYRAMITETLAQWKLIKATGLRVEFIAEGQADPYGRNPRALFDDVRDNNHLWVYPTSSGFGSSEFDPKDNPLLAQTGEVLDGRKVVANDIFRIVHDYFGHLKDGNGFRAGGEENAWRSHSAMYTPLARRAMTSETRGQNSWVNFGPHGEANRTASAADTVYADQKIGLLPEWVSEEGRADVQAKFSPKPQFIADEMGGPAGGGGWSGKPQRFRISGVSYTKDSAGLFSVSARSWAGMLGGTVSLNHLTEADAVGTFGEPLTARMRAGEGTLAPNGKNRMITGLDQVITGDFGLPPGLQAPDDNPKFSPKPIFYSDLERAITEAKINSAPASAWKDYLRGRVNAGKVKKDEVEWSGVHEWLDLQASREGRESWTRFDAEGNGVAVGTAEAKDRWKLKAGERVEKTNTRTTKEDVLDFIRENGVKVEEKMLGGDGSGAATLDVSFGEWEDDVPDDSFFKDEAEERYFEDARKEIAESEDIPVHKVPKAQAMERAIEKAKEAFYDDQDRQQFRKIEAEVNGETYRFTQTSGYGEYDLFAPSNQGNALDAAGGESVPVNAGRHGPDNPQTEQAIRNYLAEKLNINFDEEGAEAPFADYTLPGGENYRVLLMMLPDVRPSGRQGKFVVVNRDGGVLTKPYATREDAERVLNSDSQARDAHGLRVEPVETTEEAFEPARFHSSHFDEPNVLAHIRLKDRTDADGKRVLFVEEFQSDWAQKGKKEGFARVLTAVETVRQRELANKYADSGTRRTPAEDAELALLNKRSGTKVGWTAELQDNGTHWTVRNSQGVEVDEVAADSAPEAILGSGPEHDEHVVPSAPFVGKTEAWVSLAMKRVIRYAAENGYDRVAWTTGEQQADRYSLSKQVEKIKWAGSGSPMGRHAYAAAGDRLLHITFIRRGSIGLLVDKDGKVKDTGASGEPQFTGKHLSDVLGKTAAEKILSAANGTLEGDGLKIGGEGMLAFYDRIVPNVANDVLKKLGGGRVGQVNIGRENEVKGGYSIQERQIGGFTARIGSEAANFSAREDAEKWAKDRMPLRGQPGFDITPAMRERAMQGQALFSPKPRAARTPEFKAWFAGSKVVDESGEPLVVYHGTATAEGARPFKVFSQGHEGAMFFTTDKWTAKAFASWIQEGGGGERRVMPLYLSIKNPKLVKPEDVMQDGVHSMDAMNQVVAVAKAEGFDGMYIPNTPDMDRVADQWVAFRPSQIKSTNNERPTTSASISRSPKSAITNANIPAGWAATEVTGFDDFTRTLQDKLVDTKRVVQAIKAAGQNITDNIDPYLQETLFHGRAAKRVGVFAESELRPLLTDLQTRGIPMQEFEDYLWARHAAERNAQIAKVNKSMPDGGSGMTNAQAAAILNGQAVSVGPAGSQRTIKLTLARMQAYATLAARVDAITNRTLDLLVAYGLETQATIDNWRASYKAYAPLKRDMESDNNFAGAFNLGLGTGQGFSVKGSASQRAMGSERGVIDIVANIAMQRERAIVRGEKNRIAQAVYGLAVKAPNPDFWIALNPDLRAITKANELYAQWQASEADYNARLAAGTPASDPAMTSLELRYLGLRDQYNAAIPKARALQGKVEGELVRMGMNPADAKAIARDPIERYVDPRTGMTNTRLNPRLSSAPEVLTLRINGENRFVMFSNDERAKAMVEQLKNMNAEQLGYVLQGAAEITRWFASVNTQYNPVFGLVNGFRDAGSLVLNLGSTPLKGQQAKILKYAAAALVGIYTDLRAHRAGRQPTSIWAQRFEDMGLEGGQTGYRDMFQTSAARADAMTRELKALSDGKSKWVKINERNPIFAWLSDYNTSIENSIRVATYQLAIEMGQTKAQAANLAKNITVNFNKKGTAATTTGALYAFFNAAVQGTARMGVTMLEHRGDPSKAGNLRLSSLGAKIVVGGLALGVIQALLAFGADWDDDQPPQFVREKNFLIPMPNGHYIALPMPLGFNVFPNIGRIATELALKGGKDAGKSIVRTFSVLMDSFNPVGGSSSLLAMVLPTALDPLEALRSNKDWTGRRIAKEDYDKNNPTPGWSRTKDTATPWAKALSYGINYATGGGQYGKGLASPTPDQIDYLVGQVTGGVGRELGKVAQTAKAPASGEELPLHKIPVAGRFYGETKGAAATAGKFYENLEKIGAHADPVKRMAADHKTELIQDYFKNHPEARLRQAADQYGRKVAELTKEKRRLVALGEKDRVKSIEERTKIVMQQFNDKVTRVEAGR